MEIALGIVIATWSSPSHDSNLSRRIDQSRIVVDRLHEIDRRRCAAGRVPLARRRGGRVHLLIVELLLREMRPELQAAASATA
jgi:hypothetical protein